MVRTLINNIFGDPFVGIGILGTTVQSLVVRSDEVEMLKQLRRNDTERMERVRSWACDNNFNTM